MAKAAITPGTDLVERVEVPLKIVTPNITGSFTVEDENGQPVFVLHAQDDRTGEFKPWVFAADAMLEALTRLLRDHRRKQSHKKQDELRRRDMAESLVVTALAPEGEDAMATAREQAGQIVAALEALDAIHA